MMSTKKAMCSFDSQGTSGNSAGNSGHCDCNRSWSMGNSLGRHKPMMNTGGGGRTHRRNLGEWQS